MCDIRVAGRGSRYGIPVNRIGLTVDHQELVELMDLIGAARAQILLEGHIFGAEALSKGLLSRVVDDERVVEHAATALRIAAGSLVNRWHKRFVAQLRQGRALSPAERAEAYACFATEDYRRGREAFARKQVPEFIAADPAQGPERTSGSNCHDSTASPWPASRFWIFPRSWPVPITPWCWPIWAPRSSRSKTGAGDDSREMGVNGESTCFAQINRNKQGVALNLKTRGARRAVRTGALGRRVVENYRVGVTRSLGVDYDTCPPSIHAWCIARFPATGSPGLTRARAGSTWWPRA